MTQVQQRYTSIQKNKRNQTSKCIHGLIPKTFRQVFPVIEDNFLVKTNNIRIQRGQMRVCWGIVRENLGQ